MPLSDGRRRLATPPKTGAKSFAGHALGVLVFLTVFYLIHSQAWNLHSFFQTTGRVIGILWLIHYVGLLAHRRIYASLRLDHTPLLGEQPVTPALFGTSTDPVPLIGALRYRTA